MIKTILIALVYFLIGIGIASCSKSPKKDDPGYIAFTLIFWPLIVAILIMILVVGFIVIGIGNLVNKWRGE